LRRVRHDGAEDERVDEEQQERVDEGPEEAEHRPAVAGFEIARHQALDEPPVSEQAREITKHDNKLPDDSVAGRQILWSAILRSCHPAIQERTLARAPTWRRM